MNIIKNKFNEIPITFTKKEDFKVMDSRFINVEIQLMHTKENFNNSYFSKESVERAIPSLANTPILAYMEKDETDLDDFSDHRREYKDGEFEYFGEAIGIIPEKNNARFEMRPDDNGIGREYLIVDGLVWTKWNTPLEIFDRREGQVAQSMELHEDCSGYVDEQTGLFHFIDYKFYGACCLGKDIQPAMAGANIKVDFSMKDFSKEIHTKMEEFKDFQLKIKEGGQMNKKLELLEKFSKTKEDFTDIDLEAISEDELEVKLTELAKSDEEKKKEEDAKKKKEEEDAKKEEEDKKKFETEEEEKKRKEEERKKKEEEDKKKEGKSFEEAQTKITELEAEVEELREFKQDTLTEKRQSEEAELFAKYDTLSTVKEFEAIKEKSADFETISDLEKEIALVFARVSMSDNKTRDFSKEDKGTDNKEDKIKFSNDDKKDVLYGGLLD